MADETEIFWSPGDVAKRLEVSPSGLRRLAGVYAQLYGELPKDSSGTSRQWPSEAVRRLEQARALMAAGQARSIKDALLAVESGATPSADAALALGQDGRMIEALGVVAARLEALQDSNARLESEVAELRADLGRSGPAAIPSTLRPVAFGAGAEAETTPEAPEVSRADPGDADGGVLVRVARTLERILKGRAG